MSLFDDFWSHFTPEGECLVWSRARIAKGYGEVWIPFMKETKYTHHVAFFLTHGYWPKYVLHTCDNPPCGKPSHLVDADHEANMLDAWGKGRLPLPPRMLGSTHPNAKLTDAQVIEMRSRFAAGEPFAALGRAFGISRSVAHKIVTRRAWKHLHQ